MRRDGVFDERPDHSDYLNFPLRSQSYSYSCYSKIYRRNESTNAKDSVSTVPLLSFSKIPSKKVYHQVKDQSTKVLSKYMNHQIIRSFATEKTIIKGGDGPGEKEELKLLMSSMREELNLLLKHPELRLNWGRIGGYIEEISAASTSCPIEIYNIAILGYYNMIQLEFCNIHIILDQYYTIMKLYH